MGQMSMFEGAEDVTLHPDTIEAIDFILRWALGASELEHSFVSSDNKKVVEERMDLIRATQVAIQAAKGADDGAPVF